MLRSLDGACFYTSGKAEEGVLSQDSFLFSEVFTFEFGLTPQFTLPCRNALACSSSGDLQGLDLSKSDEIALELIR